MPVEFTCCECGARLIVFGSDAPPAPPLCGLCLHLPGWTSNPKLRGLLGRGQALPPISPCGND